MYMQCMHLYTLTCSKEHLESWQNVILYYSSERHVSENHETPLQANPSAPRPCLQPNHLTITSCSFFQNWGPNHHCIDCFWSSHNTANGSHTSGLSIVVSTCSMRWHLHGMLVGRSQHLTDLLPYITKQLREWKLARSDILFKLCSKDCVCTSR